MVFLISNIISSIVFFSHFFIPIHTCDKKLWEKISFLLFTILGRNNTMRKDYNFYAKKKMSRFSKPINEIELLRLSAHQKTLCGWALNLITISR